jgi:hypothetical protein
MTRALTPEFVTAINAKVVEVFFAVYLDFESGPVGIWSGYGDLTWDGKSFLGAGELLSISSVEESSEIEAKGASVTLSGIPSAYLSLALTEPYQGRSCTIYFGVRLASGSVEFTEVFSGELDQMNITENADTTTIAVSAENVLIRLERPVIRRYTDQDQRTRFATDGGFKFVAALQDKEIYWGRKAS